MPTLDEPALRDLMHHATHDLHAPPVAARTGTTGPRSRAPGVLVALGASGAAAAAAVGLVVIGPGSAHVTPKRTAGRVTHAGASPAQKVLYRLASVSERAPLGQVPSSDARRAARASFTAAQLAALPTEPSRLRAALVAEGNIVRAAAVKEAAKAAAQARNGGAIAMAVQKVLVLSREIAAESPREEVFTQAASVLGDARTSPPVRAAVYEVLATTPGVSVTGLTTASGKGLKQTPSNPTPLIGRLSQSEVEIRALTSAATSPSIVVNGTTGAVIALTLPLLVGTNGVPAQHLPPLTIAPTVPSGS